jgi:hypothetical protein
MPLPCRFLHLGQWRPGPNCRSLARRLGLVHCHGVPGVLCRHWTTLHRRSSAWWPSLVAKADSELKPPWRWPRGQGGCRAEAPLEVAAAPVLCSTSPGLLDLEPTVYGQGYRPIQIFIQINGRKLCGKVLVIISQYFSIQIQCSSSIKVFGDWFWSVLIF